VLAGGPDAELHTYNQALPLMMVRYLGPGLLGLGITALIAGFMSGMAGNVSAFSTVWTYDIYKPLINKKGSDSHYVLVGRLSILIGVIVSIGAAYLVQQFHGIMDYVQALFSIFVAPLLATILLGMFWKRATALAGFLGLLLGIVFSASLFMWVKLVPRRRWPTLRFRPTPSRWPRMSSARCGHSLHRHRHYRGVSLLTKPKPDSGTGTAWSTAPPFCPRKNRCRSTRMLQRSRDHSWKLRI
jgi:Na+/proline symporter